jgi:hypothetical protein
MLAEYRAGAVVLKLLQAGQMPVASSVWPRSKAAIGQLRSASDTVEETETGHLRPLGALLGLRALYGTPGASSSSPLGRELVSRAGA